MIYGVCGLLVQTLLLRWLLRWFAESRVLVIGLIAAFTNEILLALAPNKAFAFGAIALGTVASVSFPAISSIKANNVADSEQVCAPFTSLCLGNILSTNDASALSAVATATLRQILPEQVSAALSQYSVHAVKLVYFCFV